ncbi:MAG: hypothetical protein M4579_002877 [Chaenotheca gracillima]|nr:MAG: hypothetical protein M4579_002877 [Chaenotheca gracillima]
MSVRVQLDKPFDYFTNLDYITGSIVLSLPNSASISSITAKLEAESKTRLADHADRNRTELEVHKLLYRVLEVFPAKEIKQSTSSNAVYTLTAGTHTYPFQFKLPFNNNCSSSNSLYSNLNFAGLRVEIAKDTDRHVKRSLPPSLTGFPGEAEIRYYVKVTVVRPEFYKGNHRAHSDFKFFPIEPPRPPVTDEETYARRQHEFMPVAVAIPRKKSMFEFKKPEPVRPPGPPPRLMVDARLPNPAIITCNEPLPVRVIIKVLSDYAETLFLQSLHIELVGFTNIRAHELSRTESASWVIQTYSNLSMPLGEPKESGNPEIVLDNTLWKNVRLPNTVCPTFETCNLSRHYELEVRVGLGYGSLATFKNQVTILPLRIPVQVFSGIAPPEALLQAVGSQQRAGSVPVTPASTLQPPVSEKPPDTPTTPSYNSFPAQPGEASQNPAEGSSADIAPPSYEDAMAEEIGPVDGMRRDYDMPSQDNTSAEYGSDQKTPGGFRRDSERLFPDNPPGPIIPDVSAPQTTRAKSTRKQLADAFRR